MTLSCDKKYQKRTFGPGVYINESTIADVQDISGMTLPFMDHPVDIGLKLYLEIGRNFQPELVIAGDFKRDPATGEVIGWGGAFVVQEALSRLGYTGTLTPTNELPAGILEPLVGKKILRLSYVSGEKDNGKPRYSDWNQIGTPEDGPDDLLLRWKRSLQRGDPKNYRPQLLEETPIETKPTNGEDTF